MITAAMLRRVRQAGSLWEEVESVKDRMRDLAVRRPAFFLTAEDLVPVLDYKLRRQLHRTAWRRAGWTSDQVERVTLAAFSVRLDDRALELRARVAILTALPGIGVPVASAILAVCEPARYGIIDFRAWRQVFGRESRTFSIEQYNQYMGVVWRFADELGWPAQVVDWCIWQHDMGAPAR